MKSKHTPTPWKLGKMYCVVAESNKNLSIVSKDAFKYYGGNLIGESISQANAKRIVECVNALEGIEGEQMLNLVIESKKYQEIKEVLENMIEHLDQGRILTLRKDSIIIEALRNSINK